jgi:hypothetical protein
LAKKRGKMAQNCCDLIKMKKNNKYYGKHCCDSMTRTLEDCRIPLDYDPQHNIYFIPFIYPSDKVEVLDYCPWCAKKIRNCAR